MLKEIIAPVSGLTQVNINLYPKWESVVKNSIHMPGEDEIDNLAHWNRGCNSNFKYISENIDHWATPKEFIQNQGGDCEDFAIYKFYQLALPKYLAVGILKESNLAHAVCVVYCNKYENWIVLDCMTNDILTWPEYLNKFGVLYLCDISGVYY